jgi:hypothetical protein
VRLVARKQIKARETEQYISSESFKDYISKSMELLKLLRMISNIIIAVVC